MELIQKIDCDLNWCAVQMMSVFILDAIDMFCLFNTVHELENNVDPMINSFKFSKQI